MSEPNKKFMYAFALGREWEISETEIAAVMESKGLPCRMIARSEGALVVETESEQDLAEWQERLGGTVKIGVITGTSSKEALAEDLFGMVSGRFFQLSHAQESNKPLRYQFGFSLYGAAEELFRRLGLDIKRKLKAEGLNSRLIVSKKKELSSVIVVKERLLSQGMDILVIKNAGVYYIGYTVAAQNFKEYSEIDYGRPSRDDRSGMLPPKLAKIMINLSGAKAGSVILDPFCGSGTVLQQALLLGFKTVIGSDISDKAVSDTRNNLKWLETKLNVDVLGVKVFKADALAMSSFLPASSVDAIVTEPYLGPAHRTAKGSDAVVRELGRLYLGAFRQFRNVLKTGGTVVAVFPVVEGKSLVIAGQISELGFSAVSQAQEKSVPLVYQRENQRVAREIVRFRKV